MSNTSTFFALFIAAVITTMAPPLEAGVALERALKHPGFNAERTSIVVADAETGQIIARHNADLTLNPASCAKLITATAALANLGPDYRFHTKFYADREPGDDGAIGTLTVVGGGDPMLTSERLWRMVRNLADRGVRRITRGVIIDEGHFDAHAYPRKAGADSRAYSAQTGAFAVNFNGISVEVSPGSRSGQPGIVTIDPPVDYVHVINALKTGGKFGIQIVSKKNGTGETLTVKGRIPPRHAPKRFYRSVTTPNAYASAVLRFILRQNGIEVSGPISEGRRSGGVLLLDESSDPLAEIIRNMNKYSNNFIAEQVLKHLGAVRMGAPGSTRKGVEVIASYLRSIGVAPGSYVIENGSGLSDQTRVSANLLTKVLVSAWRDFSIGPDLAASLAIVGVDGTTRRWTFAPKLSGMVRAKTGTLGGVSTLAGFAPMADGRIAAFAILANGLPRGVDGAHRAQLEVVRAITEYRNE